MSYYAFCIHILSSIRFNKAQLVFTVPGLLAAIVVTKPMVKKKLLNQKWYQYA